ncbi:malic enzyme, NAD binding domain protein [Cooperia oncophora]
MSLQSKESPSNESAEETKREDEGPHTLDLKDPKQKALYKLYRPEIVTPKLRGIELLRMPWHNKGMAFTLYERQFLGIHGLIPPAMMTAEQQAYRTMVTLRGLPDDLARYIELDNLQDRNEKLFYRVICENVKELMRIVYTPTVGLACQKFGFIFRNPKGLYITINDNTISRIYEILANWPTTNVKAIVVTDGERILGLGDLGTYGMGIPIGKLALYVALGGVHPEWCLPILIDVGTNNEKLLKDPFYTGLRRKRVRGPAYDLLMDYFMIACTKRFGRNVLIQYEDFGNLNAYRLLDKYKQQYNMNGCCGRCWSFDNYSTSTPKWKLCELAELYFFGCWIGAATGVAEMCVREMVEEGLTVEEACAQIYMIDIDGLITKSRMPTLTPRHFPFAKEMEDTKDLLEVVKQVKPHAIIGASTKGGAFTEAVIKTMAANNERPIIFALSNPTSNAECTAEAAIRLTDGKVLFASGSPFENVVYKGKTYKPGQGNNAYIFPGVGLGAVLFSSKHIADKIFLLAARAATGVAEMCVREMVEEGLTVEEACAQIYMIDIDGLITKSRMPTLTPRHFPFAKEMEDTKDLLEVVKQVKPHAIIGASTKGGAFTEAVIKTMAANNERPIIFALSNPTSNAECTAEAAIRLTDCCLLRVRHSKMWSTKGKRKPGQGNNAYIFPGVGLGAVLFSSKHITDKIFLLAAREKYSRLYPRLKDIRELSIKIAVAVAKYLYHHNLATLYPEPHDIELYIRQHIYTSDYQESVNRIYDWPAADAKHGYPIPKLERKSMEDE